MWSLRANSPWPLRGLSISTIQMYCGMIRLLQLGCALLVIRIIRWMLAILHLGPRVVRWLDFGYWLWLWFSHNCCYLSVDRSAAALNVDLEGWRKFTRNIELHLVYTFARCSFGLLNVIPKQYYMYVCVRHLSILSASKVSGLLLIQIVLVTSTYWS